MPPWPLLLLASPLLVSASLLAWSLGTGGRERLDAAIVLAALGTFLTMPCGVYLAAVRAPDGEVFRLLGMIGLPLAIACSYRIDGSLRSFPLPTLLGVGAGYLFLAVIGTPAFDPLLQKTHAQRRLSARIPSLSSEDAAPESLVGELARALADEDPYVRRGAAGALRRLAPVSEPAVAALAAAARDPDGETAINALEALAALGAKAGRAAPALVALLAEPHPAARRAVERSKWIRLEAADGPYKAATARAVGGIGPAAASALPGLAALFESSYGGSDAVEAVIAISSEPARVLEPFVCDARPFAAQNVRGALARLNTPEARAALGDGGPFRVPSKCKPSAGR